MKVTKKQLLQRIEQLEAKSAEVERLTPPSKYIPYPVHPPQIPRRYPTPRDYNDLFPFWYTSDSTGSTIISSTSSTTDGPLCINS